MPRRSDLRVASLLAICTFLFAALFVHGHFASTDEVEVYEQAKSLWERGDCAVPAGVNTVPGKDGRLYPIFAVGQSVLALPWYVAGKLADRMLPASFTRRLAGPDSRSGTIQWGGSVPIFMVGLYSPAMCALLVAVFYLFERRLGVSAASAALASALLAGTTYVATMSVFFLQNMTEALLLFAGFFCFHEFKRTRRWGVLAGGAFLASLTLLIRIPGCMGAPALVAYTMWVLGRPGYEATRRETVLRAIAFVGLPAAAVLGVHVALNSWRFGTTLGSPYLDQIRTFTGSIYPGVYGFLLSPGGSIFIYSPLLVTLYWTLPAFWRAHRAECATILGLSASFLVGCSLHDDWTGLYSAPGPRFVFSVTPFLMLPLGAFFDAALRTTHRIAVAALSAAGLLVQLVSMSAHWGNAIEIMRWKEFVPALSFVWIPNWCPLAGGVMAIAQGSVDPLLWKVLVGAPGIDAAPAAAAVVLVLWGACMATGLLALRRVLRDVA